MRAASRTSSTSTHRAGRLACGAFDLLVPVVPDQEDRVPVRGEPPCLGVHLADERARRVDHLELASFRGVAHRRRDAVGGEDGGGAAGDLVDLLDEDRAAALERRDDVLVVDDLLAHVDRRSALLEGELHDLDRALDACAERARGGEQHPARTQGGRPVLEHRASPGEASSARVLAEYTCGGRAALGPTLSTTARSDGERTAVGSVGEPGGLHVDCRGTGFAEVPALGRAGDALHGRDWADLAADPAPPQLPRRAGRRPEAGSSSRRVGAARRRRARPRR